VSCLDASQCWAAGSSTPANADDNFQPNAFVESWSGASWAIQPSPDVTALSFLNGLACVPGVRCWADGSSVTDVSGNNPLFQTLIEQLSFPARSVQGLWMVNVRGAVFGLGHAARYAPHGSGPITSPVVAIAATADRKGHWVVDVRGHVRTFGDATFHGSMNPRRLVGSIEAMAPTPSGLGYWLVSSTGRVTAFGDARNFGSITPQIKDHAVAIVATPDGNGYWIACSGGGVFSFGDAEFYGSPEGATSTIRSPLWLLRPTAAVTGWRRPTGR
jgi:hypothetical protein